MQRLNLRQDSGKLKINLMLISETLEIFLNSKGNGRLEGLKGKGSMKLLPGWGGWLEQ